MDIITNELSNGALPTRTTTLRGCDAWGHSHEFIIEWRGMRVPAADEALGNVGQVLAVWVHTCPVELVHARDGSLDLRTSPIQVSGTHVAVVEMRRVNDQQVPLGHPWDPPALWDLPKLHPGEWRLIEVLSQPGDQPMDIAQAAAHLGLSPATVRAYRRDGRWPEPDGHMGQSGWWWQSTIDEWQAARPGKGGRPRKTPHD